MTIQENYILKKEQFSLQIPVIADLPVGKNLHDHASVSFYFTVDSRVPSREHELYSDNRILQYVQRRTGTYVRLKNEKEIKYCPCEIPFSVHISQKRRKKYPAIRHFQGKIPAFSLNSDFLRYISVPNIKSIFVKNIMIL